MRSLTLEDYIAVLHVGPTQLRLKESAYFMHPKHQGNNLRCFLCKEKKKQKHIKEDTRSILVDRSLYNHCFVNPTLSLT